MVTSSPCLALCHYPFSPLKELSAGGGHTTHVAQFACTEICVFECVRVGGARVCLALCPEGAGVGTEQGISMRGAAGTLYLVSGATFGAGVLKCLF
eukprot:822891-Pelagomonas_calceolata.AAC.1